HPKPTHTPTPSVNRAKNPTPSLSTDPAKFCIIVRTPNNRLPLRRKPFAMQTKEDENQETTKGNAKKNQRRPRRRMVTTAMGGPGAKPRRPGAWGRGPQKARPPP